MPKTGGFPTGRKIATVPQTLEQLFPTPRGPGLIPQPGFGSLGIPTGMSQRAIPAAREGARAGEEAARTTLRQTDGTPPLRGGVPEGAGPSDLIPSIGRGFGIPSGAFDPNAPGGIGRAFGIAPGLLFDPSEPGGVRPMKVTDITQEDRLGPSRRSLEAALTSAGATEASLQDLMQGGFGNVPVNLRRQPISPRQEKVTTREDIFSDPAFQDLMNRARETIAARFNTARSQLSNLMSQTGGFGSGEHAAALTRLNALQARMLRDATLQSGLETLRGRGRTDIGGAAPQAGGGGFGLPGSLQFPLGGAARVLGFTPGLGPASAAMEKFGRDISAVRGSAKTFLEAGIRSAEAIREGQAKERLDLQATAIADELGLKEFGPDISPQMRVKLGLEVRKAEQEKRDLSAILGFARGKKVEIPEGVSADVAKEILAKEIQFRRDEKAEDRAARIFENEQIKFRREQQAAGAEPGAETAAREAYTKIAKDLGISFPKFTDAKTMEDIIDRELSERKARRAEGRERAKAMDARIKAGLSAAGKAVGGAIREAGKIGQKLVSGAKEAFEKSEAKMAQDAKDREQIYREEAADVQSDFMVSIRPLENRLKEIEKAIEKIDPRSIGVIPGISAQHDTLKKQRNSIIDRIHAEYSNISGKAVADRIRERQARGGRQVYSESQLNVIESQRNPFTLLLPDVGEEKSGERKESAEGGGDIGL